MRDRDTNDDTIFPDDEEGKDDLGTTRMSPERAPGASGDDLGRTVVSPDRREGDSPKAPPRDLGPTLTSPPPEARREPRPGDTVILRPREAAEEVGFLVVWSGPRRGDIFKLDEPRSIIGRDRDVDVFVDDNAVTGRHASIRCEPRAGSKGEFVLRDLDSVNGTAVNGKQIDEATVLHDDDVITVGTTDLVFKHVKGRSSSATG